MHTRETEFLKLSMWGPWAPHEHPDFMTDLTKDHEKIDKSVKEISVDTSDLKERVDALTLNMDNIQEEFVDIKEKVDSLYYLEDNPVFIALKERVEVCETRLNGVDINLQGHQAAIEQLQTDFTNLSSAVELLRSDMEDGDEALQAQINAHGTTLEDHWGHIKNLEETTAHILTELTEAKEDIKQLKEVSGQHTTDIQYLKAQQESDDTRLTAAELKLSEHDAKINSFDGIFEELIPSVQKNADDISALKQKTSINSTNIQALQNTTNDLQGRVESLESGGGGGEVDPEVTTRLTSLEGAVGDWGSRDSDLIPEANLTQAVTNLISGQNAQNTNISNNMNDITKLTSELAGAEERIEDAQSTADIADGKADANAMYIGNWQERDQTLLPNDTITASMENAETKINTHTSEIATLDMLQKTLQGEINKDKNDLTVIKSYLPMNVESGNYDIEKGTIEERLTTLSNTLQNTDTQVSQLQDKVIEIEARQSAVNMTKYKCDFLYFNLLNSTEVSSRAWLRLCISSDFSTVTLTTIHAPNMTTDLSKTFTLVPNTQITFRDTETGDIVSDSTTLNAICDALNETIFNKTGERSVDGICIYTIFCIIKSINGAFAKVENGAIVVNTLLGANLTIVMYPVTNLDAFNANICRIIYRGGE